eukprot:scaffold15718_cov107-Isochrysis_galbana.AAC.2
MDEMGNWLPGWFGLTGHWPLTVFGQSAAVLHGAARGTSMSGLTMLSPQQLWTYPMAYEQNAEAVGMTREEVSREGRGGTSFSLLTDTRAKGHRTSFAR